MESHRENKNGDETTITVGSPGREEFQNQGYEWSEEFDCEIIDGYLAPFPLSIYVLEEEEHEPELSHSESSKKRRTTEGNEELFFRLFKFSKVDDQYLLEMHEAKTGRVDRSHLFVNESNGKCKVGAYDLPQGNYVVVPVLEDPCTLKFPQKHELSLQQRLSGWTVETRKRGNGKEDKFYYHGGRQFRSFVEVTTFILYSTKLKDLKTRQNSEQVAEPSVTISSSDNHGISTAKRKLGVVNITTAVHETPRDDGSSSSTIKSVHQAWLQVNDQNSSIYVEDGKDTTTTTASRPSQAEVVVCRDPNKTDEIEAHQFMQDDFVCDIFDDDADFRGGQV